MLVNITLSKEGKELLKKEDLAEFQNFFSTLPGTIKVVWDLGQSENLASDELTISVIATGIEYRLQ